MKARKSKIVPDAGKIQKNTCPTSLPSASDFLSVNPNSKTVMSPPDKALPKTVEEMPVYNKNGLSYFSFNVPLPLPSEL